MVVKQAALILNRYYDIEKLIEISKSNIKDRKRIIYFNNSPPFNGELLIDKNKTPIIIADTIYPVTGYFRNYDVNCKINADVRLVMLTDVPFYMHMLDIHGENSNFRMSTILLSYIETQSCLVNKEVISYLE